MEFLQDLSEAKLIGRSKQGLKRFNAQDLSELLFLHICALQIMKHEFHGLPMAQEYVKKIGPLTNFNNFMASRNEIFVFLHVLTGRNAEPQRKLLKDQEASRELIDRISINMPFLRKYLRLVLAGKDDEPFERRFLLMLERELKISNGYYRAIRRLVSSWKRQSRSSRKLVMTRLLQIMRSKARRSEMLGLIELLSKQEKLEKKKLKPLDGEGVGQNIEAEPKELTKTKEPTEPRKKSSGFLKQLAINTAIGAAGGYAGYRLVKHKKST